MATGWRDAGERGGRRVSEPAAPSPLPTTSRLAAVPSDLPTALPPVLLRLPEIPGRYAKDHQGKADPSEHFEPLIEE
jgi:hypothetical protein